ncbi:QWRF motif-containing protein 2-like [Zingiber officinale]|uniref:QWRF motif-containing protein 2-like n=1 Tax=Zingiber officinale TaxID=94328 RepID=UPI001C4B5A85|nr:QWRF motif-containing protein 2-like [Zingiber officinale]
MATTIPAVSALDAARNVSASRVRPQKKVQNPSPSPRRRDPSVSSRAPLSSCEKDNAAAPKPPRGKEINSRYLATSFPSSFSALASKGGSLSSAPTRSSSKGTSFTSSSCSTSIASSSSSSSSTATSSHRRFRSPIPASRPSSPMALPPTSLPTRSKSVDRTRPIETSARRPARESTELSSAAAKALRTTTRSLSVSFQGESFSYQTSMARPASPCPIRKPTPERRTSIVPSSTPTRNSSKSESYRALENHHRWPAARTQQSISLTRSLDCSAPENVSVLAAMRSLRQSTVLHEGARRASFDGGEFSLSFDTDSLSSGGNPELLEFNTLPPRGPVTPRGRDVPARFLLERGKPKPSPGGKCTASSKPVPAKKSFINGLLSSPLISSSPRHCPSRPSSPGKLAIISPRGSPGVQRVPISPITSSSDTVPLSSNGSSMLGMVADIKRGKYGERQLEDAHRLRLLNNRQLQWRWVNAQLKDTFLVQKLTAEKHLYGTWITTSEVHKSLAVNKLQLQTKKQYLKLNSILKGQIIYLEEWSLVDKEHTSALSGAIEALKASTIRLPVVNGAKADFQEVRNAVGSAVDVMQAMGTSICAILSKVLGRSSMVSELAELAVKEQAMMDQCRDLLSAVAVMHVKQCSLLGHIAQLRRPSLIQP